MRNTRLIQFLKTLNHNELRQFSNFINSPYFNKNKNVTKLFEILYKSYPEFETSGLNEEKLFEMIFKDKKFEYFKIKNLFSDLFGLGKEFLAVNIYRKDIHVKERYLLQELRNRDLDAAFEQAYKTAQNSLEKTDVKDENYYMHKINLQLEISSYYVPKKPNVDFHYLQERLDLFVNYSATFMLKIYNIMLHERNQNNYNFEMKMFDQLMMYLEKTKIKDNPTLEVYYNVVLMEKTKDEKYFYLLKELKTKYRQELSAVDNYMLYLHLDGYCSTAYNSYCRTDLLNVQFLFAKEHPVSDMTEHGKILYPDFLNQVKKAVRVNEFEWAEEFIKKYKNRLTQEKENTLNFCYGFILYKNRELDKALDLFSKTNFSSFILKIQVKLLLLQIYFDKKYFEQAILMIDTFRHYLSREKTILDSIKISLLEFLKITADLIKISTEIPDKNNLYRVSKIKDDIENMSSNRFGIKLWLKEKVSELS
ncbi:MAG: hypothetical protein ABIY50_11430 [Ignavibacteria bacterium]